MGVATKVGSGKSLQYSRCSQPIFLDSEYGGDSRKAVEYIEGVSTDRGTGWEFGRDIYLSELYELMERVNGVDHVESIDIPAANLPIEKNQLPLSGTIQVTVV